MAPWRVLTTRLLVGKQDLPSRRKTRLAFSSYHGALASFNNSPSYRKTRRLGEFAQLAFSPVCLKQGALASLASRLRAAHLSFRTNMILLGRDHGERSKVNAFWMIVAYSLLVIIATHWYMYNKVPKMRNSPKTLYTHCLVPRRRLKAIGTF